MPSACSFARSAPSSDGFVFLPRRGRSRLPPTGTLFSAPQPLKWARLWLSHCLARKTHHDPTRTSSCRPGASPAGSGGDRFRRPSLLGHCGHRLPQAARGPAAAGPADPRLRSRPAACHHRRGRARPLRRGRDRAGPGLRPGRPRLGRLDAAGRLALPDARLGPAGAAAGPMGVPFAQRPDAGQDARRGDCTSSSAIGRSSKKTIWTACPRRWWKTCGAGSQSPPGPLVAGPDGHRAAGRGGPQVAGRDRSGHRRPVRRQPAGNRPVPLPHRQLLHAPGRQSPAGPTSSSTAWWRSIWPTWSGSWPPSART